MRGNIDSCAGCRFYRPFSEEESKAAASALRVIEATFKDDSPELGGVVASLVAAFGVQSGVCRVNAPTLGDDGKFCQPPTKEDGWCGKWEGGVRTYKQEGPVYETP